MPSEKALRGLCSTCMNASDCTYLRSSRRPVVQCEEFRAYTPAEVERRKVDRPVAAEDPPAATSENLERRLGLCRSCDNRETCDFSSAEGGVWHCDEYR